MISSLSIADHSGVDIPLMGVTGRELVHAGGLVGSPAPRDARLTRPQASGVINPTRFTDGSLVDLILEASSRTSITDCIAQARSMMKPMQETLDYNTPAVLKWTEDVSGLALQKYVKLASDLDAPIDNAAAMFQFQAQLASEDARSFSQALTTFTSSLLSALGGGWTYPRTYPRLYAISGGGTVTVTNNGKRPTPGIFKIQGDALNAQIVNLDTGARIVLDANGMGAEITAGNFLQIDTTAAPKTITLNGASNRYNFLNSAATTWFEFPPGDTHLQLVASSFDGAAQLSVSTRDAY